MRARTGLWEPRGGNAPGPPGEMFGIPRSSFEFEQTYSKGFERVLDRAATAGGGLRPTGTEVGGSECYVPRS